MDKSLLQAFWNCGDAQIIEFALLRAHLNKREKDVIECILDDCMTQEECAEHLGYSTRAVQDWWKSAMIKLLTIPWVFAYAQSLKMNGV